MHGSGIQPDLVDLLIVDQIGKNMDYLRPGTELMLPPDHSDTSFTRRQEPTRTR